MKMGGGIRQSVADLSFNDSGALPAIAFVGGSAVYLYIGLGSAAVSAAVVVRPARTLRGQDALATAGRMPGEPK